MADHSRGIPRSDELLLEIAALGGEASEMFAAITPEFARRHDDYSKFLIERLSTLFAAAGKVLAGLDWLTVHYRTRHLADPWSYYREWLQAGVPLSNWNTDAASVLGVYSRRDSPYISYLSSGGQRRVRAYTIEFGVEGVGDLSGDELQVTTPLTKALTSITSTPEAEDDLTQKEFDLCQRADRESVSEVRARFAVWHGTPNLSERKALVFLRNSCRATLRGLNARLAGFSLPRRVVLCPVFVAENVIGGVAFLSRRDGKAPSPIALAFVANTILSDLRLVEEAEREAGVRQVEELNRAREEFVQRVAHNIQSPLRALAERVQNALESLEGIDERVRKLRDGAGEIMLAFTQSNIDDLLRLKLSDVDLGALLATLQHFYQSTYEEAGLRLVVKDVPSRAIVRADKDALWEVFENLLTNAWRYALEEVSITVEQQADAWAISVHDDGPNGIDSATKPQLFQPGVHGPLGRGEQKATRGYGLFLSRRVIELHGGDLTAYSGPRQGTTFTVKLPINPVLTA